MESKKDELYSDKYKTSDFCWGISLGEGKTFILITQVLLEMSSLHGLRRIRL
jgi:hypothetical protein